MTANLSDLSLADKADQPARQQPRRDRSGLILGLLLALVGFLLIFQQTATPPTANREIRIFKIVSGMLASGDYRVPRIDNKPALNKPPLYYWLASAAKQATGLPDRIAFRLPSILAALALLACLFVFCRVAGLAHLALPAVLAMAMFYEFYHNARVANFEMLLSLFSFASVLCFYQYMKREELRWLLMAGAALALALLTKATPALPMVFLPVFLLYKFHGKARLLLRPKVLLLGLVLPLLIGMAWHAWMLYLVPQAQKTFKDQGLLPLGMGRKAVQSKPLHYESPLFYFYKIFKIALPACLFFPLFFMRVWRTRAYRANGQNVRWAFHAFAAAFVLFSFIAQKQEHYLLPVLPYLAILLADAAVNLLNDRRAIFALQLIGYLGLAMLLGAALLFGLYFHIVLAWPLAAGLVFAAFLILATASLRFNRRRALPAMIVACALGWWLSLVAYYGSFNVWDTQFKTGEVYQSAHYSAAHWEDLFQKHPALKKVFKTSKPKKTDPDEATEE